MNVLSLFDGKSSGYTALELAGIPITNYYSSEVDKYAIQVSNAIHPNQIRLGDVTKWREWDINLDSIDLVIAGSPCQGFSFAGKQLAFDDPRSKLFFVFVDILNHVKSLNKNVKFMLENVKMKKEHMDVIDEQLGVESIMINSALVSAQNRQRNYWTNIPVDEPIDRGLMLIDLLEHDIDRKFFLSEKAIEYMNRCVTDGRNHWQFGHHSDAESQKSSCVTANHHKGVPYNVLVISDLALQRIARSKYSKAKFNPEKTGTLNTKNNSGQLRLDSGTTLVSTGTEAIGCIRRLSPRECFRLQTVPEHYIDKMLACGVSNSQLYKIAGNGWTDEVIAHIFQGLKE